jgi:hypothetical protein
VSRGKRDRKVKRKVAARPVSLSLRSHWRADGGAKTPYMTQTDALVVADERRQESGVVLNVYRCDFCSAWHLGNADGPER